MNIHANKKNVIDRLYNLFMLCKHAIIGQTGVESILGCYIIEWFQPGMIIE